MRKVSMKSLLIAMLLLLTYGAGPASAATQTLTVTKAGSGTGTVTSSPAGINCGATCTASFTKNTNVTLTPTADPGSTFAGWSGACTGTGSCVVKMSANKTVTATFNLIPTGCSGTSSNLALNCPATASSTQMSSTLPQYVDDGNATTRWSSAQQIDPQWIYIDLGSTKPIGRVVLNWETAYASSYQIQTSPDASTWTTIFSTTTGNGGTDDLTVSGAGRYVRMYGTVRGTQFGYSLWEFEVYAPSWPSTYFDGPLKANTPLPVPGHKFLILWHNIQGHTWAQTQSEILQRETDVGRRFDGLGLFYGGGGTYHGWPSCSYIVDSEQREAWVHSRGSIPVVTWAPNASLSDINAGLRDDCIKAVAIYFKQFPFTIMLRPMHEFNYGNMYWVGCGQPYINAFRRIVTLFQGQGAANVGFIWSPVEAVQNCPGGSTRDASYPGDDAVDWIGPDRYNHNCPVGGCFSSPCHGTWAEWWELFNYTGNCVSTADPDVYTAWSSHKGFMPAETGSNYDPSDPNRKANWFRNIVNDPRAAPAMQYLIGIEFFDQDVHMTEPRNDWLVDSNHVYDQIGPGSFDPVTYQGFKDLAASPMFNP
jgi:hypothetical protein